MLKNKTLKDTGHWLLEILISVQGQKGGFRIVLCDRGKRGGDHIK